jgi:DDE superfamily endonuclease
VYQQPDEAQGPQVGLDAMSTPLIGAGRAPLPAAPGKPLRYDTESQSHGTANIFMAFAPCAGPRCPKVTEPRTQVEGAHVLHELVEQHAPHAEKMRLVLDNRTTHTHAALYEVFDPSEAKRIADTCAMHYPPQQGSWFNRAEMALSHRSRPCLGGRLAAKATLIHKVQAWNLARNERHTKAHWQFTPEDACVKLRRLSPTISK